MVQLRIIHGVTDHLMVRLPEWVSAIALAAFAVTLFKTGATFAGRSYVIMAEFATENVWASVISVLAGGRLLALIIEAFSMPLAGRYMLPLRAALAGLCGGLWLIIAGTVELSNPLSPSSKVYAALGFLDLTIAFYLASRTRKQVLHVDRLRQS